MSKHYNIQQISVSVRSVTIFDNHRYCLLWNEVQCYMSLYVIVNIIDLFSNNSGFHNILLFFDCTTSILDQSFKACATLKDLIRS